MALAVKVLLPPRAAKLEWVHRRPELPEAETLGKEWWDGWGAPVGEPEIDLRNEETAAGG